ncbi:pentatricopeptide repeat-containing protein At1g71490-like [Phragmites australis]|uniref:pentatricopeptide repeat-containing protein At1g71490-like n=1 Tax=Phragmites australis TaxID=29695 RepID=UPI002D79461B|nr:pentatricopeptide repeat-containing protein At1g71490-like [Phragmites australis]
MVCVWNAMVAMYVKCRELEDAHRVFDGMPVRDVVSWNTMVSGYASMGMSGEELLQRIPGANIVTCKAIAVGNLKAGNYDEVTRLVSRMRSSHGPRLDFGLVIGLKACGKSGYLRIGRELHGVAVRLCFDGLERVENSLITIIQPLFVKMFDVFCIEPRVEHFSCMIDLYCREGLLRMADEIIDKMPFQPTAAMLATLIEACRIHGKTEIGDRAAKRLLAMRTNNPGHYNLIANMHISANVVRTS